MFILLTVSIFGFFIIAYSIAGNELIEFIRQLTQDEIAQLPATEAERIERGQSPEISTTKHIATFFSVAGVTKYTVIEIGKVYFSCSEEIEEDENCIRYLNDAGDGISYFIAAATISTLLYYRQEPHIKRNLEIFLRIFFNFPFTFQLLSYLVGFLEDVFSDSENIPNAVQWPITILYTSVAILFAATANPYLRQKIRSWCCNARSTSQLAARDFRGNIELDDRNIGGLFCDAVYNAFARISDIRGLIAGTQNMLAVWRCEPRSIYFPYVTARWVPAAIIATLLTPYSYINHPLKPMEYRSLLERTIDKAQQIADMTFFYFSLLLGISAALNCEQETGYPTGKLIIYLETILLIYLFTSRNCSPFSPLQQPQKFDDESPPSTPALLQRVTPDEETPELPPPRRNQASAQSASIDLDLSSTNMPPQSSSLVTRKKSATRQREIEFSSAKAYQGAGFLKHRKASTTQDIPTPSCSKFSYLAK